MRSAYALPAPAKLNLFLRVLGRRGDGYHELRTAFAFVDLADWLDFERRDDGALARHGDVIGDSSQDLALRAAQRLQAVSGTRYGADIHVTKRIPAGAGLGGGSSDAATTLVALNRLWGCGLSRDALAEIGVEIGADVPVFVRGDNALAAGRGERLTPLALAPCSYAVVWPQVHVSTREIFSDLGLTATDQVIRMADFSAFAQEHWGGNGGSAAVSEKISALDIVGRNDLQEFAIRRAPAIGAALAHLAAHGPARMTGSGAAVFVPVIDAEAAQRAVAALPDGWSGWAVRQLPEHPLRAW
jgi:4-diphosphocytidyl-2-C-methyl-D-erythritol kinase